MKGIGAEAEARAGACQNDELDSSRSTERDKTSDDAPPTTPTLADFALRVRVRGAAWGLLEALR